MTFILLAVVVVVLIICTTIVDVAKIKAESRRNQIIGKSELFDQDEH